MSVADGTAGGAVLTNRQRRLCVLLLLASGHSSKEMAHMLDTSKATVDNDAAWWETRFGARSRAQTAAVAIAAALLRPSDVWFDGTRAGLLAFVAEREHDLDRVFSRIPPFYSMVIPPGGS